MVLEKVLASQHVFYEAMLKIAEFNKKYGKEMEEIIITMAVVPVIIAAGSVVISGIGVGQIINAIGAAGLALFNKLINAFQVPLFEPAVKLIKVHG